MVAARRTGRSTGGAFRGLRPFAAQLIRLALIVVAILVGRWIIVSLPMVAALERLPGLDVSARDLITGLAYFAILVFLVGFAKSIESVMAAHVGGFPWQSLVAQALVLAGIVFAYGALTPFAAALLGRHVWAYSVVLLLLAIIPLVGIGRLLDGYVSALLERWEG